MKRISRTWEELYGFAEGLPTFDQRLVYIQGLATGYGRRFPKEWAKKFTDLLLKEEGAFNNPDVLEVVNKIMPDKAGTN